jgi:hypothetical protein
MVNTPSAGSVTQWLRQLKAGDPHAAQKLWQAYFQRLLRLARQKLLGAPRRAADEEDVALSALDSTVAPPPRVVSPAWTTVTTCGKSSSSSPSARCAT